MAAARLAAERKKLPALVEQFDKGLLTVDEFIATASGVAHEIRNIKDTHGAPPVHFANLGGKGPWNHFTYDHQLDNWETHYVVRECKEMWSPPNRAIVRVDAVDYLFSGGLIHTTKGVDYSFSGGLVQTKGVGLKQYIPNVSAILSPDGTSIYVASSAGHFAQYMIGTCEFAHIAHSGIPGKKLMAWASDGSLVVCNDTGRVGVYSAGRWTLPDRCAPPEFVAQFGELEVTHDFAR